MSQEAATAPPASLFAARHSLRRALRERADGIRWETIAAQSVGSACCRLLQEERRGQDPETAAALDAFLARLDACIAVEESYTLILGAVGQPFVTS